jgi:hypothetical protein
MPCSLYESVRAGVLEMDAYFRKRPKAAVIMGMSTDTFLRGWRTVGVTSSGDMLAVARRETLRQRQRRRRPTAQAVACTKHEEPNGKRLEGIEAPAAGTRACRGYSRIDVSVPESQLFVVARSTFSVGSLWNICYHELLFGQVHVDIPNVVRARDCSSYRDHMARFLRHVLTSDRSDCLASPSEEQQDVITTTIVIIITSYCISNRFVSPEEKTHR